MYISHRMAKIIACIALCTLFVCAYKASWQVDVDGSLFLGTLALFVPFTSLVAAIMLGVGGWLWAFVVINVVFAWLALLHSMYDVLWEDEDRDDLVNELKG